MAIYHLSTKPVSRAEGRSAPAAAAYRAGDRVFEHATGQTWDYSRKQGVEHSEIVLPPSAAASDTQWAGDRERLWNAAEAAENRKDARVAREWEVALPHELDRKHRVELAREFAVEVANRYQCAVDVAIHRAHRLGDERNWHAHMLATTRTVEAGGLGRKTDIELGDRDRRKKGLGLGADEIAEMRARWAELANQRLREHQIEARIDHRSLKDQGIEREPTVHLGPSVVGMERRGIRTEVGERVREEQRREMEVRLERARELGELARQSQEFERSIFDLSGDLKAALRERDEQRALEAEARVEGKQALKAFRDELGHEREILKEMSLERAKELRRSKVLELEKERKLELDKRVERDGPDFGR